MALLNKLFPNRIVPSVEAMQRAALTKAKEDGVSLAREGKHIAAAIAETYMSEKERDALVQTCLDLSSQLGDVVEFDALVCAVLSLQASGGLVHEGETVVAPNARMAALLPPNRDFTKHGVATSLTTIGRNALAHALPMLDRAAGAAGVEGRDKPFVLDMKRRRLH